MVKVPELRRDEEEWLRRFWEEKKPTRMTFIELRNLYIYTKNRAKELGVPDPETTAKELLDRVFDPSLTYVENLGLVDAELIKLGVPTELPKELEELEYWKKRVKELEEELKKRPMPRLEEELKRLRERIDRLEKLIKERVITRAEYEKFRREVGEALSKIVEGIRKALAARPAPTVPTMPEIPPYIPQVFKPFIGAAIDIRDVLESDIEYAEDVLEKYALTEEQKTLLRRVIEQLVRLAQRVYPLGYGVRAQRERLRIRDVARSLYRRAMEYIERVIKPYLATRLPEKDLEKAISEIKKAVELIYSDVMRM